MRPNAPYDSIVWMPAAIQTPMKSWPAWVKCRLSVWKNTPPFALVDV
jgi:hypothetical protein